jgi:hypothetical protein
MPGMAARSIRSDMIDSYIGQLREDFGGASPQIEQGRLRALYREQDYAGMVRFVRDSMRLDLRVRVGLVNRGGRNAPAWVATPAPMPRLGTKDFKGTLVTVFLRKSFLRTNTFERVTMAIAHEMSHVVLEGLRHSLSAREEAVDLTAMLLGYRDIYLAGSEYVEVRPATFWDRFQVEIGRAFAIRDRARSYEWLSYLSPEEVCYAARKMGKFWVREKGIKPPHDGAYMLANLVERLAGLGLVVGVVTVLGILGSLFGFF